MKSSALASFSADQGLLRTLRRGAGKVLRSLGGASRGKAAPAPVAPIVYSDPSRLPSPEEVAQHQAEYQAHAKHFGEEVKRRGLGDADKFYWYHTVDLGNGLVTPGDYDYRGLMHEYPFPENMSGMSVMDVGSATGFFAFEFERRGADVTSVDLPSIAEWDLVWSDREIVIPEILAKTNTPSIAEWDRTHTHGPFDLCHKLRKSKVRRCLSRIYDLTPQKVGRDQFDMIFLGDVIGHLWSPVAALSALAPLCRREMIISLDLVDLPGATMCYNGGEEDCKHLTKCWFQPNWEAMRQMLFRVGFEKVEVLGVSRVMLRRTRWIWMDRHIIRASK